MPPLLATDASDIIAHVTVRKDIGISVLYDHYTHRTRPCFICLGIGPCQCERSVKVPLRGFGLKRSSII